MPLIFNSITQFYEQIGRRRSHKQRNQLDTLDCIFIGPNSAAATVCPHDLATHPDFPAMRCIGWDVISKQALVSEVQARYVGKLDGSRGNLSDPVITTTWHEGSISWTNWEGQWEKVLTSGYFITASEISYIGAEVFSTPIRTFINGTSEVHYVSVSRTCRYTARGVTFKYLTSIKPDNKKGLFAARAADYQGIENQQIFVTGISDSMTRAGLVKSVPVWDLSLMNLEINDLANGWWEVSEVYSTRAYVKSDVPFIFTQ